MTNMAYTKIIGFGDASDVKNLSDFYPIYEGKLNLEKIKSQPSHFSEEYFKESFDNEYEIFNWRRQHWGVIHNPRISTSITKTDFNKFNMHLIGLETAYTPPISIIEEIANRNPNLKFIVEIEIEPGYCALEFHHSKFDMHVKLFHILDFRNMNYYENLSNEYLNQFESIKMDPEIYDILDYTSSGEFYLKLKCPNGEHLGLLW